MKGIIMEDKQVLIRIVKRDYEHVNIFAEDLLMGQEMYVAGLHVSIAEITHASDHVMLNLHVTGALLRSIELMTLMLPNKAPITILIEKA
jgi:hypothetical protein